MESRPLNDGALWSRDDLILAFELYCRIPFRSTKASNPKVKELASLLQRTPASVARKLGNFGAFDPALAARDIVGLSHGSKLDRIVWDEFHSDWGSLTVLAAEMRMQRAVADDVVVLLEPPRGPSERTRLVKQRLHQQFFRDAVISSYNSTCCVTGLSIPECLIAGHIIPWSVDERRRADPTNGVCMSATFDRLFDSGLMTIGIDGGIVFSQRLLQATDDVVKELIVAKQGMKIRLPARFHPDQACLEWHRRNVFENPVAKETANARSD